MADKPLLNFGTSWKALALIAIDIAVLVGIRHKAGEGTYNFSNWADPLYVPFVMNVLYLSMIYFGCRLMKTREPFEIKSYMFWYNLYQTAMNFFIVAGFMYEVHSTGMRYWGAGVDKTIKGLGLSFLVYAHYHNKYIEFFDTLFMILRKKNNQISFLHVYHHSLLTWSWWAVVFWAPGGDAWFGACYNSFIHVLMYSYYLFATFGVRCPWKKVLTQMQMVQFCFCFTHSIYVTWCGSEVYPVELTLLQAFVMVNMLVLFGNFYMKSYAKENKDKKETRLAEKPAQAEAVASAEPIASVTSKQSPMSVGMSR